ncbi:hypothetical protein JMUB7504_27460 [Staphylococcus aureus]
MASASNLPQTLVIIPNDKASPTGPVTRLFKFNKSQLFFLPSFCYN